MEIFGIIAVIVFALIFSSIAIYSIFDCGEDNFSKEEGDDN